MSNDVEYTSTAGTRITDETKERIEEMSDRMDLTQSDVQRIALKYGLDELEKREAVGDASGKDKYPTTRPARIIGGMIMSPVILMIVLSDAGLLPPTKAIAYGVGIGIGLVLLSFPIEEYIGSGESPD